MRRPRGTGGAPSIGNGCGSIDGGIGPLGILRSARALIAEAPAVSHRVRHPSQERFAVLSSLRFFWSHDPGHIVFQGEIAPTAVPQQRRRPWSVSVRLQSADRAMTRMLLGRLHISIIAGSTRRFTNFWGILLGDRLLRGPLNSILALSGGGRPRSELFSSNMVSFLQRVPSLRMRLRGAWR